MLDPDGQGIILTNATFAANISSYDTIRNYTKSLLDNITSLVYLTRDGDDLKISSLYLYDWIDENNNTEITSDKLSVVNRAYFICKLLP